MTTAATTLIERVRARLLDYGNGATTLGAAITDTTSTTIYIASVADVAARQFLMVDTEMMEVIDVYDASSPQATVVRGARGSTAATHADGAIVRIDPVFGSHEYLRYLNQALDDTFPSLYSVSDTHTASVAANTYEYDIPTTCHRLARVEIATSTSGVYEVNRNWDYQDNNTIILEDAGAISTGRAIRFIGYSKFDAMTLAGNLDADYPDGNENALEYLIVKASARALRARQAPIARRDAFIGVTDSFQAAQPFMSTMSAKDYEQQAKDILKQIRMPRIPEFASDPGRVYFGR